MTRQATFLGFKPGDVVLVEPGQGDASLVNRQDWWMGQIIWAEGGARDPQSPTMFQIANVDTGVVEWINADEATRLVLSNYEPDATDEYTVCLHGYLTSRHRFRKRLCS
ncbi:DUF3104 domain-containing protein [Synechococcus sp. MIT S1220]|uniref:DUF3104 domain-containing protein n=1 Tax=Synechococcus sp. MIT S1220 TaxID=3082549 RepID=UPI0039B10CD0